MNTAMSRQSYSGKLDNEKKRLPEYLYFAVAFKEDKTSPSLITVKEGEHLKLQCSYCVKSSKQAVSLSWYKEDHVIHNGTHFVITNHGKDLGVPVVQQNKDEGLYKCEVNYEKQKTSKFITVIVTKGKLH